ncbi:Fur-regulated basic protein FbpA [Bacillus benzoevorans]|nr:Fur-regulated basic protein FbpA [Bacillus benzoevorans]
MLIDQLLAFGMFKKGSFQLFELPLQELQDEYDKLLETRTKNPERKYGK